MHKNLIYIFVLLGFVFTSCERGSFDGIGSAAMVPALNFVKMKSPATERIDTFFTNRFNDGKLNGVVLFAENGKIVYENAFGYSDFQTKDSLSTNSIFQLASVSKQFTAAAILILKERQELSLNDKIEKFIPNFPYKNITIKQLLSHSSGLPNYMHFSEGYWKNKSKFLTNDDLINLLRKHKPAVYFSPGKKFLYSNTGYAILSSIIEKVSGKKYKDFLKDEIFTPLAMNSSYVLDYQNPQQSALIAIGHKPNKIKETLHFQDGVTGDKGIFSTVEDLLIWDKALYDETLISKETLQEAFTPAFPKLKDDRNYGYGWRIFYDDEDDRKIVYHGGWWKGYKTYFVRDIEKRRTAIVLLNTAMYVPFKVKELVDLFETENKIAI